MIGMVVGVMVGVLILSAALFPVIDSATTTERTFTNEGLINLNYVDDTFNETIVWNYTAPNDLTIGSDTITLPTEANYALTIMANEDFFLRWVHAANDENYVQLYRTDNSSAYRARVVDSQNMTITIGSGSITFDNGSATTVTISYTEMYCVCASEGDYVLKPSTETAYLKSDSEVFAYGGSYVTGLTFYTIISGTPTDDFTRVVWPDSLPMTYTDMTDDLAEVSGYIGLYTLKEFKYSVTNTNTSATGNVSYTQFIVPAKVTAELAVHPSQDEINLLETIPILITVGLILGIVGTIFVRRLE